MNGINEKEVGKRIEFIRKKEKLSRREFGKMVNKSEDAVYNIEKARAKISDDIIYSICNIFHINKNWLLNGEDGMYETNSKHIRLANIVGNLEKEENLFELTEMLLNLNDRQIEVIKDLIDVFKDSEKK